MDVYESHRYRETSVYGSGSPGGKGTGLVTLNECDLPRTRKLPTHILSTSCYDRYIERGHALGAEELAVIASILDDLGDIPIGVRSSATNEGVAQDQRSWAIHAGENTSFMLPNNHWDRSVRLQQLTSAIRHIYEHFIGRQGADARERMAVVINPIPGLLDDTLAGPFYYPYISGVANSFFPHALKMQNPNEGFARIAFGHGYATVLDDFPVISMVTIKNPIPLKLLQVGHGQQYFYALNMTKNSGLQGDELETMTKLHVRFANYHKIKLLGVQHQVLTIEELVQNDLFSFKSGLSAIMETIHARVASHFQIEFVFNIDFKSKPYKDGAFHVVQLTILPERSHEPIAFPRDVERTYLSLRSFQGHGIKKGVRHAVVVSPLLYTKDAHDHVRARLGEINARMKEQKQSYLMVVPGRLGCRNRDWGIDIAYTDVNQAVAIFEFGVDISGRAEPLPEADSGTGGTYGSHFLYMIQGGYDEDQRRRQTRMFGTQGTHFLTNIISNDVFYGYIEPGRDACDAWLFAAPRPDEPVYVLTFPKAVDIYADSLTERCTAVSTSS